MLTLGVSENSPNIAKATDARAYGQNGSLAYVGVEILGDVRVTAVRWPD
jgi:hypothetical protein